MKYLAQFETRNQSVGMEILHDLTGCCVTYILLLVQYLSFHCLDATLAVDQSYSNRLSDRICIETRNTTSDLGKIAVATTATEQRQTEYLDDPDTYSDTLSTFDAVTKQYLSLPYPSISEEQLQAEKNHYLGPNQNTPHTTYTSISLEYLNHFLYEGRNNFR